MVSVSTQGDAPPGARNYLGTTSRWTSRLARLHRGGCRSLQSTLPLHTKVHIFNEESMPCHAMPSSQIFALEKSQLPPRTCISFVCPQSS